MRCLSPSSLTVEYNDDQSTAITSGTDELKPGPFRRRHSSFHPKRRSSDKLEADDGIIIRLDLFLTELERRLDFLESYGNLNFDSSISRAYATLQAVRAKCSQVSDEVIGAGRRRARIMVETVESRYQDAMVAKESLNEKVHEGIALLDTILTEFEAKAYKMKEKGFSGAAGTLMDEGRRVVDGGIERAREVIDEGVERARKAAESLEEHIEAAIAHAREKGLIKYDELPVPWRINPHILKGYRFTESKVDCIRSVFGISNESVNIWSHAIGLLIVLSIAFHFYPTSVNFSVSTNTDVGIAAVFFFAACKCLVCSTMWHTMNSVADQTLMRRFACVDYTGISLLIAASIMTTEYTAFYCEPVSRWIYIAATATLGIGGVILPWHPTFNRADMAWARVAFYVTLGATGFAPVAQLNLTRGAGWAWQFYAPITKSITVYLIGAVVYASKVPERWCPGAFDYFGGSHNLWHLAVLGGILFHYVAMQEFFTGAFARAENGCALY
ncbi:hemolysin-III related-domain-containing protein [Amylocarpus encephaloides]|uniref:Hemolysin-III related-domain-containing protein n=1 Tax=Amylocarpus encephaloides TaxID=45428 RepID=A0A9P7YM54_9HELO|nr:hemolysin-III related-domain-containing protein [Amylocarpus encephaloides]